jgi:S-ribosylhomocysteine lyase LuxS involved in autoinducer biosynthesis
MQSTTNDTFIPTKYVINGRVMGGTLRRKNGIRTLPVPARAVPLLARAETPALPPHPPPQLEVEDLPPAKRARLQTRDSSSAAADGVTTDSPDDTPTDPVTHAVSLPSAATSRAPRRNWKPEEDGKLTEAVNKHGKDCWAVVATLVPGRTNQQCRTRWVHTLDPANEKGKWTPEEDTKLAESVEKHGKKWTPIAAMVPGRTSRQCRQRWTLTLDPANVKKGQWTPEEDAKLTVAVKKHGKNWAAAAAMVPGRTNQQCRTRWVQTLDPANEKGKWTPEQDAKLTAAVKRLGKKWVAIAAMVPGRTNQHCRKRWVQTLDPDRATNTVEEEHDDGNDEALVSILV